MWLTHKRKNDFSSVQFSSVAQLCPTLCYPMRPPCPSPSPRVHSNSCPSSQWCHPAISSSVVPFSSCPQTLPASESFPLSQLFKWGGQSTGVSALASFLPKKSQGWSPTNIFFIPTSEHQLGWLWFGLWIEFRIDPRVLHSATKRYPGNDILMVKL